MVAFLKSTPPREAESVLAAGVVWTDTGWDTTKAVKEVRKRAGLEMITTKFQAYLNAFLFGLCFCAGLDISALKLSRRASEVAFGLSE